MSKSAVFSRLLRRRILTTSSKYTTHPFVSTRSPENPISTFQITRNYATDFSNLSLSARVAAADRALEEVTREAARERQKEREERIKAGLDVADLDAIEEPDYDYFGLRPRIEKYERQNKKDNPSMLNVYEDSTDSDSEPEDEEAAAKQYTMFEKKFEKHQELLDKFAKAETLDDASKLMKQIDKFEGKHFALRPEYRVIGELMNRMKVAEGKDKFLLQMKLNRALRMVECMEAFDPNDPANYGIIQQDDVPSYADREDNSDKEDQETEEGRGDDDGLELDDLKEKDSKYLEKINEIDKKLEKKLAELEYTFGKKGKLLEEEIRDLAEERNELTEKKRQPLYRKGFDVRLVDVNRTTKVTKGGQIVKYSVILVCGNYNGLIGFAKTKAPAVPVALRKAYEKCFQNLHYVERHEDHTIAHAVQTSYKKTKLYLWPAPTTSGMKAGRTVELILNLAGFKNVKSKVIGSRNPHNTVKAVFKALNAIETPQDVQEKFGRTVVESYLL
ncbi:hypothetical protein ACS0TY_005038 [Phlomoides rotata]